ncbi:MAG: anti-sigma factor [Casimicrobiaceae bacterium]
MNLSDPARSQRLNALAAEYVLGTLPARTRARLARTALADAAVAAAIRGWEMRLAPLADGVAPITPPPRVWQAIAARLGIAADTTSENSWWTRVAFWRGLALAGAVTAFALAIALLAPKQEELQQPIVAVLSDKDGKLALIASAQRGDRFMTVKAVGVATPDAGKALELWLLPTGAAPRSLGVIPAAGVSRVTLAAPPEIAVAQIPALAVSLEPVGGSPTGAPTGPVLYTGKIERMY